jgi:hypothetical protein
MGVGVGRNEDFDNALWSQPEFEELSALASLFYIWSWTNPHCGMAGIYEVGRRTMTNSKVEAQDLDRVLAELDRGGWLYYRHGVLWVRARVKRLRRRTPQIAVAVAKDVVAITAGHPLRVAWLQRYDSESWLQNALSDAGLSPHEQTDSVKFNRGSGEPSLSSSGHIGVEEGSKDEVDARTRTVSELFAYWQERCGHPNAMLSAERRRKIAGRLREGFKPQQVREAIDGARIGAVVTGKKRFDDIELICRSASKLESFIGREGPPVDDGGSSNGPRPRRESPSELLQAIEEATG